MLPYGDDMFKKILLALVFFAQPAVADPPVIEAVHVKASNNAWSFDVTLSHGDTGWDHYAEKWRIVDEAGNVLGVRNLAHPHINEQPFTRSLSGVVIPEGTKSVGIQARDNITSWSTPPKMVTLP